MGVDPSTTRSSAKRAYIFDVGVLPVARGFLRSFQHPIHLGEIEVTEKAAKAAAPCGTPCCPMPSASTSSERVTSLVVDPARQLCRAADDRYWLCQKYAAQIQINRARFCLSALRLPWLRDTAPPDAQCVWGGMPYLSPDWQSASKIGSTMSLGAPCYALCHG